MGSSAMLVGVVNMSVAGMTVGVGGFECGLGFNNAAGGIVTGRSE